MNFTYMKRYYDEMTENIMREALTKRYWEKESAFCAYYENFLKSIPESLETLVEKIMEQYNFIEAQILEEAYLQGALDLEILHKKNINASDNMRTLRNRYDKNKKQIYSGIRCRIRNRQEIYDKWSQKQLIERQMCKEMSDNIRIQYEMLNKKRKAVRVIERKCLYLQGALDRARMIS